MSTSFNKIIIVGNLGKEPEVRNINNHTAKIVILSVATNESWKNKQSGLLEEKTEWHRVVLFGKTLTDMAITFKKGARVFIEGKLQTQKWTDKNGIERTQSEIVLTEHAGNIMCLNHDVMTNHIGGQSFKPKINDDWERDYNFHTETI